MAKDEFRLQTLGSAVTDRLRARVTRLAEEEPTLLDTAVDPEVSDAASQPGLRLSQTLAAVFQGYAHRPAFRQRTRELVADELGRTTYRLLPSWDTVTYGQAWANVEALAAEWHLDAEQPIRPGDHVCQLGYAGAEYVTLDMTCAFLGAVTVPLQSSGTVKQLLPIAAEVEPLLFASSVDTLEKAVGLALSLATLPRLLVFDYDPRLDDHRERFEVARAEYTAAGGRIEPLADAIARGRELYAPEPFAPAEGENPTALLIYTSGSTGTPKGAMYTERMVFGNWQALMRSAVPGNPVISMSYMPMSHFGGRAFLHSILARGGCMYFTEKPDLSTFFEDVAMARPTELMFVPRLVDMLAQRYHQEIAKRPASPDSDAEVKELLRETVLGGRVITVLTSAAVLTPEMREFLESCLDITIYDAYGTTETSTITINHRVQRPPIIDYKLVDVPDLGYFGTDKPYPRGELLVKSRSLFPGYFKRPELMAEVFDDDGYYRTGDIMAEGAPDELWWVDRRAAVLKLSQGEFVTISHLEFFYAESPLVHQIFVYGTSERAFLLAVVVPVQDARKEYVQNGESELKDAILHSLREIAARHELNSYEIPRDILLETEAFSRDNGLLSDMGKHLRPRLTEHYGPRLEALYEQLAEREAAALRELQERSENQPVLETVRQAVGTLWGSRAPTLQADARLIDLGGDSLSAVSLSTLLGEVFGVEVPVNVLIGPTATLERIAEFLDGQLARHNPGSEVDSGVSAAGVGLSIRDGVGAAATFASVHGAGSTTVPASDLALEVFLDEPTRTGARSTGTVRTAPQGVAHGSRLESSAGKTVLLTGATGFLGRFLCLELLSRAAEAGGTVICLARGANDEQARANVDRAFDSGDAELLATYSELAEKALVVRAGDLSESRLGLSEETWQQLVDSVDHVVHAGALVNHVLGYAQLFGPNVVGTAELIRFALTGPLKPITYVSTVGVATGFNFTQLTEDADIRELYPERELGVGYAHGYGASKWASEVLLRNAHDQAGLPVTVLRPDMILAHSRYRGQLNVPDMFTRLLLSLCLTGIAPKSFYSGPAERAHYTGLPVDFTAAAIVQLGVAPAAAEEGFRTFHVVNPNDDGISLDTVVQWLAEEGVPIERLGDYDEWYERVDTALRGLGERTRARSLLPILTAFAQPTAAVPGSPMPAERFREATAPIPPLRKELIRKYLSDLSGLGYLPRYNS